MRNILEVARLIRVLEDPTIERGTKVEQLKLARNNGDITPEEAIELSIEYSTMWAHDFTNDAEKMIDFIELSREEFLTSYSYLTEDEYNLTKYRVLGMFAGKMD